MQNNPHRFFILLKSVFLYKKVLQNTPKVVLYICKVNTKKRGIKNEYQNFKRSYYCIKEVYCTR